MKTSALTNFEESFYEKGAWTKNQGEMMVRVLNSLYKEVRKDGNLDEIEEKAVWVGRNIKDNPDKKASSSIVKLMVKLYPVIKDWRQNVNDKKKSKKFRRKAEDLVEDARDIFTESSDKYTTTGMQKMAEEFFKRDIPKALNELLKRLKSQFPQFSGEVSGNPRMKSLYVFIPIADGELYPWRIDISVLIDENTGTLFHVYINRGPTGKSSFYSLKNAAEVISVLEKPSIKAITKIFKEGI